MSFDVPSYIARTVPGLFILNSGINKINLPKEQAEYLQAAAAKGIPPIAKLDPEQFGKFLSYGEMAVGALLVLPFVPNRIAGAALGAFSAGLLAAYFRTPGLTEDDGVRPTAEGTPIAKDSWLAAIAAALLVRG